MLRNMPIIYCRIGSYMYEEKVPLFLEFYYILGMLCFFYSCIYDFLSSSSYE